MICWHKLYHFTVANTRFTAPLTRRGKTKFATIKWYNLCQQIIQSQTCYPLIVMQIFRGYTIRRSRENDVWSCYFLVIFRIFPNFHCHFRRSVCAAGCDVVKLYVWQRYRSCTFCKRKTRGETQFWMELALPYILANHNEINSDYTLPFIIFLIPVSCDCSNSLWRQCLLLSAMFPMTS